MTITKKDLENFVVIIGKEDTGRLFFEEKILNQNYGFKSIVIFDQNQKYDFDNKITHPTFTYKEGVSVFTDPTLFKYVCDVYSTPETLILLDNAQGLNNDEVEDFITFEKSFGGGAAIAAHFIEKPVSFGSFDTKIFFNDNENDFVVAQKSPRSLTSDQLFKLPF